MTQRWWIFLGHYLKTEEIDLREFINRVETYELPLLDNGLREESRAEQRFRKYIGYCWAVYFWRAHGVANQWLENMPLEWITGKALYNARDNEERCKGWQRRHWVRAQRWRHQSISYVRGVAWPRLTSFGEVQSHFTSKDKKWINKEEFCEGHPASYSYD